MSMRRSDRLELQGLELECIVGVRPSERRHRQRIRLNVTLELDLGVAGRSGRISQTVDYSRVADEIRHLLRFREYRLLEMATEEVSAMLLSVHPALRAVRIRLEKPEALRGRARGAAIEIWRQSPHPPGPHPSRPESEIVLETSEARLELIGLTRGAEMVWPPGASRRTLGWLVSGALARRQGPSPTFSDLLAAGETYVAGPDGAVLFGCTALDEGPGMR